MARQENGAWVCELKTNKPVTPEEATVWMNAAHATGLNYRGQHVPHELHGDMYGVTVEYRTPSEFDLLMSAVNDFAPKPQRVPTVPFSVHGESNN